ncbi:hypothetical protein [Rhizobium sp. GN54]|uniref:hypothetical protein n=1 Tax=Rhizobium sp. GN54 TaxID=2898150 RepID=UPI001E3D70F1|nr:hypothetical protein [Rhizobium sp. GN54]MCD2183503.1 hypothetical protein [Rhizobium sp. GN54]
MNLYEKFAGYTVLPIKIDWVKEQVKEDCEFAEILFIPVQMDASVLLGIHRMFSKNVGGVTKVTLQVYYNSILDEERHAALKRLVCCKELLHAYDSEKQTAKSMSAVDHLIEGIVVPPSSGMTASLASDHNGGLRALMVLLPRDALDVIIPAHHAGKISVEDVALLAGIPEAYARVSLSPVWKDLVEKL